MRSSNGSRWHRHGLWKSSRNSNAVHDDASKTTGRHNIARRRRLEDIHESFRCSASIRRRINRLIFHDVWPFFHARQRKIASRKLARKRQPKLGLSKPSCKKTQIECGYRPTSTLLARNVVNRSSTGKFQSFKTWPRPHGGTSQNGWPLILRRPQTLSRSNYPIGASPGCRTNNGRSR